MGFADAGGEPGGERRAGQANGAGEAGQGAGVREMHTAQPRLVETARERRERNPLKSRVSPNEWFVWGD